MRKLGDVNRTDSACAEERRPVVLQVFVEDAVPDSVRQQILHFDRCSKGKRDLRVDSDERDLKSATAHSTTMLSSCDIPRQRVGLVVDRVSLESESRLLLSFAYDRARRPLDEVLPVQTLGRPAVAEARYSR